MLFIGSKRPKSPRKAADSGAIDKFHKSLIEFCKSLITLL